MGEGVLEPRQLHNIIGGVAMATKDTCIRVQCLVHENRNLINYYNIPKASVTECETARERERGQKMALISKKKKKFTGFKSAWD